jgi:hypothetical protein
VIRFGGGSSQAAEQPGEDGAFDGAAAPAPASLGGRELFVRHARKDGRLVAVLRALDQGHSCIVEAEVYPAGSTQLARPGPYTFPDAHQASAFVTEAVAALMYLGCDIQAQ